MSDTVQPIPEKQDLPPEIAALAIPQEGGLPKVIINEAEEDPRGIIPLFRPDIYVPILAVWAVERLARAVRAHPAASAALSAAAGASVVAAGASLVLDRDPRPVAQPPAAVITVPAPPVTVTASPPPSRTSQPTPERSTPRPERSTADPQPPLRRGWTAPSATRPAAEPTRQPPARRASTRPSKPEPPRPTSAPPAADDDPLDNAGDSGPTATAPTGPPGATTDPPQTPADPPDDDRPPVDDQPAAAGDTCDGVLDLGVVLDPLLGVDVCVLG